MIKLSTNWKTISSFIWHPWDGDTFDKKETEGHSQTLTPELFHVNKCWVYLCVQFPWLVQSAVAGGEGRVAAAVGNWVSSCMVKPGGVQPVLVVVDTTTLQLKTGIKRQDNHSQSIRLKPKQIICYQGKMEDFYIKESIWLWLYLFYPGIIALDQFQSDSDFLKCYITFTHQI